MICEGDMSNQLVWSSKAESDFIAVSSYLFFRWNKDVAADFDELVNKNIKSIVHDPLQFPFYNKRLNIRKCVLTKHNTLYYHYDSDTIYLIRIYDTRQNPHKLKL